MRLWTLRKQPFSCDRVEDQVETQVVSAGIMRSEAREQTKE